MAASILHANPKGGTVTNGAITITETPGVMTINQTTPRGIIHWQDFSIGAGELTQFQHLDAKSATLNRVVGGIPSTIQGTLQANGQVYLVNPNGILVGPGGRVNTAAFVASTLDVPDAAFLAGGDMRFTGPSLQGVVNLGTITATTGDVILMARNVVNAGSINAPNGVAALAAGNDILLQAAGDERIVINSGIAGGGTGAENTGSIRAAQAELKAAGGNVYALAVNNTGVVRATGIAQKNGRVILSSNGGIVQNSGQLIAKNADGSGGSVKMDSGKGGSTTNNGSINASADDATKNGGTVELLGDTVTVGSSSVINVNGLNAGTVAIGVSAMIANQTSATTGVAELTAAPAIPGAPAASTAQQTIIQANSRILANSTGAGNGGRVVVWSEKQSVVGGVIEAKGGDLGGNGGLIETSGKTGLTIVPGTKVSTAAPKGTAGTWLLDPAGITVDNNTSDTANGTSSPFTQNASTNHVKASDILAALGSGSVVIATTVGFPGNNDIVVNADLPMTNFFPSNFLTLNSAGGITINNVIGGPTSNVSLILKAAGGNIAFVGSGAAQASSTTTVFLDTHLSSSATITSGLGNAVLAGKLSILSGRQGIGTSLNPFNTSVSSLEASVSSNSQITGGGIFIKNTSASDLHIGGVDPSINGVQVSDLVGFGGIEIKTIGGHLLLDSTSAERVTAPSNIKLTSTGSNDIIITNASANSIRSHFGSVTLNAGRNVTIGDSTHAGINVRGQTKVDVTAGGDVTVSGSLLKAGGGTGLTVNAGGDINILSSTIFASIIGTSGGADITLTTGAGRTFNNNTLPGGGVRATLADDLTPFAVSSGGIVQIYADKVTLSSPVIAGTSGVSFIPVAVGRAYDIGTKDASKLSFTVAELGQITADTVNIGALGGTGALKVSANLTGLPFANLLLFTPGGPVTINSDIAVTGNLSIGGGTVAGITGAGKLTASTLNLTTFAGPINLTGVITTATSLTFQSVDGTSLSNVGNSIAAIEASSAGSGGILINNGASDLHIKGAVTTTGFAVITTGSDLYFDTGGSLSALSTQLDISHGNFVNNSGSANVLSVSPGGRFLVYEKDPFGLHNLGGLMADQVTTNAVRITDVDNDPLGAGNVFYFANISPPVPPPALPNFKFNAINAFKAVNTATDRLAELRKYSVQQILELLQIEQSFPASFITSASLLEDTLKVAAEKVKEEARVEAIAYRQKQLTALAAVLGLFSVDDLTQDQKNAFFSGLGVESVFTAQIPNPSSLSPSQIVGLSKSQMLRLLGSAGYKLKGDEYSAALYSTFSEADLKKIVSAGPIDKNSFGALVAAGAGNLTINQLVAAGAGNVVGNDGNSFKVMGANGKVVSNDGNSLTVFELAKLITNDGGTLITNDGGTLITNDGGTLISQDGGTLIATGGGNVVSNDSAGLVATGGGNLLGLIAGFIKTDAALIATGGGNLIATGGGNALSSVPSLINSNGSSLIQLNTAAGIQSPLMNGGSIYGNGPMGGGGASLRANP